MELALAETGFERSLLHPGTPFTYFADENATPFHPTVPYFAHWTLVDGPGHVVELPGREEAAAA